MIVGEPRLRETDGEITVAAEVTPERPGAAPIPAIFLTFPARLAAHVTTRADGFAAALLPLAMQLGEDLTVRGELSCRLARGLEEYQRYQATWKPDLFRTVAVRADALVQRRPEETAGAVGTSFSGGVDSFHTLLSHLGNAEPLQPYRITHAVMINGFDADQDLDGSGWFASIERLFRHRLTALGVDLVVVRTNLLNVYGQALQKQSFAATVTVPALVLGTLFSRFYVPSSYRFTHLSRFPDGSHPAFDHLLGTETLEVIHDGGTLTRVEKTLALAHRSETHDLLRVCFERSGVQADGGAIANCCACEKCIRTMTTLDVAGTLGEFRCFPQPLTLSAIRRLDYSYRGGRVFAEEIIELAGRSGRRDVVRALRLAIWSSLLYRNWVRRLVIASFRREQRSPRWAALVGRPKRFLQRLGVGRGWLYLRRPEGNERP